MNKYLASILNHNVLVEAIKKAVAEEKYSSSDKLVTRLQAIIDRYKELKEDGVL